MTLATSNIYYLIKTNDAHRLLEGNGKIKLIIDAGLTAIIVIIGALILAGKIPIGIPVGVGTLGGYLAGGLIGVGITLASVDAITSIIRKYREPHFEAFLDDYPNNKDTVLKSDKSKEEKIIACRQMIQKLPTPEEMSPVALTLSSLESNHRKTPSNRVIGSLFIGRDSSLIQASSVWSEVPVEIRLEDIGEIVLKYDGRNPQKYSTVITLCPVNSALTQFPALAQPVEKDSAANFQKEFTKNNIEWINLGKTIEDDKRYWKALAYDCTFLDKPLENMEEKITHMEGIKPEEWFKPIFEKIDKAVFEGKSTLVHCQAGQSRSSTILAAYLIYTFKVSKDEAVAFLKSRRPCVNPKFEEGLDEYANALSNLSN